MTTNRRKGNAVAPGLESARPDASYHSHSESHLPPPNDVAPQRAPAPHNNFSLPRSPLIGRDHEVATVQQLLLQEQVGLLTLTGPGGIGKTRLALQVAANLLVHFVDGVYFVSLAPIGDPALVAAAIAQTLGVREAAGHALAETLQNYLKDRQLLLVLDNFEQVVAAAALVGDLLNTCRRLKVLVTSRATLHLYGEQEFPVPPLSLPDVKQLPLLEKESTSCLTDYAAMELFCQRAAAAKPDFVLTPSNAATVAEICIRLDGLPLAIELAAARIKLFSPSALLARLNQRLTLLIGGPHDLPARQRTLRDEIAWSYDLLTTDEQKLSRRLAVFVGGFTLEAAQAVSNANGDLALDVLRGVTTLVNHNLLKQLEQPNGEARFGMLETIREYRLAQLTANGEAETIRHCHAEFFLSLTETIEPDLLGSPPRSTLGRARLRAELDNLRAVLAWSLTPSPHDAQQRAEVGLRLTGALSWFPFSGDHTRELRHWMETTLQWTDAPPTARAKVLWGVEMIAIIHGDYLYARIQLEESVALCHTFGEKRQLAAALRELCLVTWIQGDFVAAQRYGEDSVALYRMLDRPLDLAIALDCLGSTFVNQGSQRAAQTLFQEELGIAHLLDNASIRANALVGLGWIARNQGEYTTARTHYGEALTIRRVLKEGWMIGEALDLLGELLQQQGEWEEARHHYLEGLTVAYEIGDKGGWR